MGKMYIVLSDETERRLRLAVVTILGGKKGDLSSAIEVAIKEWLEKHATEADITKWVREQLHEKRPGRSRASQGTHGSPNDSGMP
ncbi:MAG: hypothetical protein ABSF00_06915 [Candidatus Bathyarchaeia archaeon]